MPEPVKAQLAQCHQDLFQHLKDEHANGFWLKDQLTKVFDQLLLELYQKHASNFKTCALVAVGGYGRQELCPHSDIDLLFLYPKAEDAHIKKLAEGVLYALWDSGLKVGHSIRSIETCLEIAEQDLSEATSMLDARFLAGDIEVFKRFYEQLLQAAFTKKGLQRFAKQKIQDFLHRHKKYRDSPYLLEPNVKQGIGGLRDVNTVEWLLKAYYKDTIAKTIKVQGFLKPQDFDAFEKAKSYLFQIRFFLHLSHQRAQEILTFEAQKEAAEVFGFKTSGKTLAVEQFMQAYYLNAENLQRLIQRLLYQISPELLPFDDHDEEKKVSLLGRFRKKRVYKFSEGSLSLRNGYLHLDQEDLFQKNPESLVSLFRILQKNRAVLTPAIQEKIRLNAEHIGDDFRNNKEIGKVFLKVFADPNFLYQTVSLMHYTRFLSNYIPEFKHLHCLVLHDLYHVYTVDAHLLFSLQEFQNLALKLGIEQSKTLKLAHHVIGQINHVRVLTLAILFHDIAKGLGKGHSERGASMMPGIAARVGLSEDETDLLVFLVRHHLLLSHTAQRRDIHDPEQILSFCETVKDPEYLRALFVLTICDMRAVGPAVWNEWRGSLLAELYYKSMKFFEQGERALQKQDSEIKAIWEHATQLYQKKHKSKHRLKTKALKNLFEVMPGRFIRSHEPADLAELLDFIAQSPMENTQDKTPVHVRGKANEEKGHYAIAVLTRDQKGLFTTICGLLAYFKMNILAVQTSTWEDGRILDIFTVVNLENRPVFEAADFAEFERRLKAILSGKEQLEDRVKHLGETVILKKESPRHTPTRVFVHNDISEFYTVVELFTEDRRGLLYDVGKVFQAEDLYLQTALISTDVDQVADVFYVKGAMGGKLGSDAAIERLKEQLLKI